MATTFKASDTGSRRTSPGTNGSGRKDKLGDSARPLKRRCVSNACIACRRRKSKVFIVPAFMNSFFLSVGFACWGWLTLELGVGATRSIVRWECPSLRRVRLGLPDRLRLRSKLGSPAEGRI